MRNVRAPSFNETEPAISTEYNFRGQSCLVSRIGPCSGISTSKDVAVKIIPLSNLDSARTADFKAGAPGKGCFDGRNEGIGLLRSGLFNDCLPPRLAHGALFAL